MVLDDTQNKPRNANARWRGLRSLLRRHLPNIVFLTCLLALIWLSLRDMKLVAWTSGRFIIDGTNESIDVVIVERGIPKWLEMEAYLREDGSDFSSISVGMIKHINWLKCSINLLSCLGICLVTKRICRCFVPVDDHQTARTSDQ